MAAVVWTSGGGCGYQKLSPGGALDGPRVEIGTGAFTCRALAPDQGGFSLVLNDANGSSLVRIDAAGHLLGSIAVSSTAQAFEAVRFDDGSTVVLTTSGDLGLGDGGLEDVSLVPVSASGAVGAPVPLVTKTAGVPVDSLARFSVMKTGMGLLAAWAPIAQPGALMVQAAGADGQPLGSAIPVTQGGVDGLSLTPLANGNVLLVYAPYAGMGIEVVLQELTATGALVGGPALTASPNVLGGLRAVPSGKGVLIVAGAGQISDAMIVACEH